VVEGGKQAVANKIGEIRREEERLILKLEPEVVEIKEVPSIPLEPIVFISDATDSMLSQEITIQPEDTVVESRSA
jgi:hypothetical protein